MVENQRLTAEEVFQYKWFVIGMAGYYILGVVYNIVPEGTNETQKYRSWYSSKKRKYTDR